MEPNTNIAPPQDPPKKKKLERVYEYLQKENVKTPSTYEKFEQSMRNDEHLKKVYNYLVEKKVKVNPTFEEFKTTSFPVQAPEPEKKKIKQSAWDSFRKVVGHRLWQLRNLLLRSMFPSPQKNP
jgi:hypothetical protein